MVKIVDHCNQRSKAARREHRWRLWRERLIANRLSMAGGDHLRPAIGGLNDEMKFALSMGDANDF
jgi:hypothetical protein